MTDPHAAQGADLVLLVETEQRLSQVLEGARVTARELIEAARAEAMAEDTALDDELRRSRQELQARLHRETELRIAAALAEGRARAEAFDALPDDRIAQLASLVVERLIAAGGR
jgi:hypothetical protein